jgi:hypothetical protein
LGQPVSSAVNTFGRGSGRPCDTREPCDVFGGVAAASTGRILRLNGAHSRFISPSSLYGNAASELNPPIASGAGASQRLHASAFHPCSKPWAVLINRARMILKNRVVRRVDVVGGERWPVRIPIRTGLDRQHHKHCHECNRSYGLSDHCFLRGRHSRLRHAASENAPRGASTGRPPLHPKLHCLRCLTLFGSFHGFLAVYRDILRRAYP